MGMIGAPTEREYQGLVRQIFLQDCPITPSDITNAHKIFGPDLANIRGKTVRRKSEHVSTEIVEIPQQILSNQNMLHFQQTSCLSIKSHLSSHRLETLT